MRVLILADDLSGAADCAAPLAARGMRTVVTLGDPRGVDDADVVAIDTDSRRLLPEQAAEEVARVVRSYGRGAGQLLYKKIDSTLRGHIGAEVAAALAELRRFTPDAQAVVAPAFPKQGRVTKGKQQYSNGIRVEASLAALLTDAGLSNAQIYDAESEANLAAIAVFAPRSALWVGSAGLARHIDLGPTRPKGRDDKLKLPPQLSGPVLFVIGSTSAVSRNQGDLLARENEIQEICFDPTSMKITPLKITGDTLVRLPVEQTMHPDAARFALAYFLTPHIDRAGALVLTGGDTARAVLQTIGVTGLRVWGEVEPGVPFSVAMGAWERPVITKAGGFGDASTLLRCRAALKSSKLG
jgi:uncharacterized protein YgbK (DUF1537 family)